MTFITEIEYSNQMEIESMYILVNRIIYLRKYCQDAKDQFETDKFLHQARVERKKKAQAYRLRIYKIKQELKFYNNERQHRTRVNHLKKLLSIKP